MSIVRPPRTGNCREGGAPLLPLLPPLPACAVLLWGLARTGLAAAGRSTVSLSLSLSLLLLLLLCLLGVLRGSGRCRNCCGCLELFDFLNRV